MQICRGVVDRPAAAGGQRAVPAADFQHPLYVSQGMVGGTHSIADPGYR